MIEFLGIVNTALPLVSIIGTVLAACGMWYLSRSFVTRAEHEAVQARLGDMKCKTRDIYQKYLVKNASDKKILFVSRLSTALAGILCMVLGISLAGTKVLDLVFLAYTFRGALFIVLLFGILWKKASQRAALCSMTVTIIVGVIWKGYSVFKGPDPVTQTAQYPIANWLTDTYAVVIATALAMFIFTLAFPRKASDRIEG